MIQTYRIALVVSIASSMLGAIFKTMHWEGASSLITIGLIAVLAYTSIGLNDVYQNKNNSLKDTFLWTISFVLFTYIVGLVYYFYELKPKYRVNET
jgi:hypothetical protein